MTPQNHQLASPGKWIDGLDPGMRAHKAASRILEIRLRTASDAFEYAQERGEGEPDAIRRARVATRRARSAVDAFRKLLPSMAAKTLRRELKAMRRLAGESRSLGLERDALLAILPNVSRDLRDGVAYAAGVLDAQRRTAIADLQSAAEVDVDEYRTQANACLTALGSIESNRSLAKHAKKPVKAARRALVVLIEGPLGTLDQLHELRLRIKRLRYTDELFRCCMDRDAFGRLYAAAKAVQDRLGELNDIHDLHARVENIAGMDGAPPAMRDVLHVLANSLEMERDEARDRLLAWWNDPVSDEPRALRAALGLDVASESSTLEEPSIERSIDRAIESAVIRSQENGAAP